tara:strand:- start:1180 stop:2211 length:1032 start_codon:yes stop_codon:yes gene_type:complete
MIELNIITAFLTSMIALILLRSLAFKFNLIDYPTDRKDHTGNVPLVGGVSVFLGLLITYFFFIEFDKFSSVLLITGSLILIHGIWDDFANLKAKTKIAFQASLSAIMIYVTDVKLESLGNFFGISYPLELGILSIPLTIVAVVALTNAINMMDGLDGLAACVVLLAIAGLICFNLTIEFSPLTSILLAVASALLPFIIFNISPNPKLKVFLGDGGSLFLGYIISWALIYSAENIKSFTPSFALWCVAVPLFDFFTVIIIRLFEKRSLVIASKDHIHHTLEKKGFSKLKILLLIAFTGLLFLVVGKVIEDYFPTISLSIFIIIFLFYAFIRVFNLTKKKFKKRK